jgi:glycosyltransferase involved in cell wall biosynthesis
MPDPQAHTLLQIYPNDHPPFLSIARSYHAAAQSLGMASLVIFFGPATAAEDEQFIYLNAENLRDTRSLIDALKPHVPAERCVVIAHRYRSYWVWLRSGLRAHQVVALAHEFGFFNRLRRKLGWWLLATDYLAGGVSQAVVDEHRRTTGRTLLMPNAIDLNKPLLSRSDACDRLGLAADDINIGVVGRLHRKKRPQLAVEAIRQAATEQTDMRLIFVGDGELRDDLVSRAQGLPVRFCGRVENAAALFKAFDAILITSADEEAFGMVVLEAMRAGVRVVCGASKGPREILGDLGTYFDQDEPSAIVSAMKQSLVADENYAQACDEVLRKHYSIQAVARRLDSLRY